MEVVVVRSARRRKTVSAQVVDGVVRISVPDNLPPEEEARHVEALRRRMERRQAAELVDLEARAATLASRYGLGRPASIRWVGNQELRWGSCTPGDRTIRISTRLAGEPAWVLDYVIVHELAHLTVPGHGPAFERLVGRYPRAERARGFLEARSTPVPAGVPGPAPEPPAAGNDPRAAAV